MSSLKINLFVGITDSDWHNLLAAQPTLPELIFWQPVGNKRFKALRPGELFLFNPHRKNEIIGCGIFAYSTLLPVSLAWDAFGIYSGATSLEEMRRRIEKYRSNTAFSHEDYTIGCILLSQPLFILGSHQISVPSDWNSHIVQGRGYDITAEPDLSLYRSVVEYASIAREELIPTDRVGETSARYGAPTLIQT